MYRSPFLAATFSGALTESASITPHTQARMTPSGPVCENGRPFIADPCTGQAVCLCQLGTEGIHYPAAIPSPETLRALGHVQGPGEPSAFRSPLNCSTGLRPDRENWKALAPSFATHYDPSMALHPYSTFYAGLDLNSAARRKAATRETTSPLKAWLNEHRKNPYPTKAEKIMLAIITKMTMTQVSTWFANARRRLKKENKMSWDSSDRDDEDDKDDDKDSQTDKSDNISVGKSLRTDDDEDSDVQLSDISDVEDNVQNLALRLQPDPHMLLASCPRDYSLPHPPVLRTNQSSNISAQNRTSNSTSAKPKIWSISHILEEKDTSSGSNTSSITNDLTPSSRVDTLASRVQLPPSTQVNLASPRREMSSTRVDLTSPDVDVSPTSLNLTSSRLTIPDFSPRHVSSEHSTNRIGVYCMESPNYLGYSSSSQDKTPSPRKLSSTCNQHPRPPLDTPPDTPPFDNVQLSAQKERKSQEYEALNLKTEKIHESGRT